MYKYILLNTYIQYRCIWIKTCGKPYNLVFFSPSNLLVLLKRTTLQTVRLVIRNQRVNLGISKTPLTLDCNLARARREMVRVVHGESATAPATVSDHVYIYVHQRENKLDTANYTRYSVMLKNDIPDSPNSLA